MITFTADDGTQFHYNSDLSGEVLVGRTGRKMQTSIPGIALKQFCAEMVKRARIEALENMTDDQVLGG